MYFFLSLTTTFFQKRAGLGLTSSCVGIAIHQYVATPFLLNIFFNLLAVFAISLRTLQIELYGDETWAVRFKLFFTLGKSRMAPKAIVQSELVRVV